MICLRIVGEQKEVEKEKEEDRETICNISASPWFRTSWPFLFTKTGGYPSWGNKKQSKKKKLQMLHVLVFKLIFVLKVKTQNDVNTFHGEVFINQCEQKVIGSDYYYYYYYDSLKKKFRI